MGYLKRERETEKWRKKRNLLSCERIIQRHRDFDRKEFTTPFRVASNTTALALEPLQFDSNRLLRGFIISGRLCTLCSFISVLMSCAWRICYFLWKTFPTIICIIVVFFTCTSVESFLRPYCVFVVVVVVVVVSCDFNLWKIVRHIRCRLWTTNVIIFFYTWITTKPSSPNYVLILQFFKKQNEVFGDLSVCYIIVCVVRFCCCCCVTFFCLYLFESPVRLWRFKANACISQPAAFLF